MIYVESLPSVNPLHICVDKLGLIDGNNLAISTYLKYGF